VPSVRRLLGALSPIDRTVAHFLVPCGYPLGLVQRGELDVVLHGSDVRLVLGLPGRFRAHVVARLLSRGARFRFVSHELMSALVSSLPRIDGERLRRASRVEMPHIDVPRVCERAEGRETPPAPRGRDRWVVCSRLIESKRVDRAIREAARRNVELTIVGDGPLRDELEALAASLAPRARFVGHLSRDQALAVIAGSHKLVHLSENEGAPTVIREARALGVSVLATAVGDVARWAADDPGIEIFRPT
jgi:glycosyltransferase involved in cell wall biosynthesis